MCCALVCVIACLALELGHFDCQLKCDTWMPFSMTLAMDAWNGPFACGSRCCVSLCPLLCTRDPVADVGDPGICGTPTPEKGRKDCDFEGSPLCPDPRKDAQVSSQGHPSRPPRAPKILLPGVRVDPRPPPPNYPPLMCVFPYNTQAVSAVSAL